MLIFRSIGLPVALSCACDMDDMGCDVIITEVKSIPTSCDCDSTNSYREHRDRDRWSASQAADSTVNSGMSSFDSIMADRCVK